ncbi:MULTISPECIES: trypsin-like peptidase domain-containing protein [unclassified Streptomyces]|uniref:nSTAND1 domain-containing NTPase n=1 Tax=unclassified Streptomyces TaxID=2593676 RepID=UPI002E801F10|nr:trypsin-like peptidase domain-containing protein [Streptomyces sp. NBC_00589]WTI33551.1 trypsin-like peptidase domain-containing protein [Streptomyces sp. NBC_00775]WUB32778.1 trypsin-like peptidase domain-containing protein [Streptomyces sp. NBC_00589]
MNGAQESSYDGMTSDLPAAVAKVLGPDGRAAGAGFLVAEGVLVTCAHVVQAAGGGPGQQVRLAFPHVEGADGLEGLVVDRLWRVPEDEDVAVVRLSRTLPGMRTLPLGSAKGCRGHDVRSFGFPAQAPSDGHYGFGKAGELLPASARRGAHLQLTDANDLTTGFSGGPVLDEVTGLVLGMLTEITAPDAYERGQGVAYVTPTQVLRQIIPELAEKEVCPYLGLEPFTADHAQWFHGRKDAVRQVVTNLALQRRLTLLLGPSGSGKSSLIQAGVLRALAEGELPGSDLWLPVLVRPRQDLLAEVGRAGLPGAAADGIAAAATRRLATEPAYQRILLVIDQFEELFIQTTNSRLQLRMAAADQITAATESDAKLSVILVMRDDFYPQLAALAPKLLDLAMPGLLNVPGTLSQHDLHDIITLPSRDVGLRFQPGLPEQIITDVLASAPEAAVTRQASVTALPLLELTLRQLWRRRKDGFLTHEAYRRIGAVSGSITTWCDSALTELAPDHRPIARRVLISLVHPADPSRNVPPVRAQVPINDLRDLATDPGHTPGGAKAVDDVIAALTHHRIITTQTLRTSEDVDEPGGRPAAELIHEALIRDWGALRAWVDQDHRFQDWLNRTRDRQARWAAEKNPGDLLGGTALAEGLDWSRQRRVPGDVAAFLSASKQRQQAVTRRTRRINSVLASLLVIALIAAAGVLWQWRTAVDERQAALHRLSQQLAAQSTGLISTNPELASLLAIQAYRTSPTSEAISVLQTAAALPPNRPLSSDYSVDSVAFSPDGRILGTVSDTVRLRNVVTGKPVISLMGDPSGILSVAFNRDGTVATGGWDNIARVWDGHTGEIRRNLKGHTGAVNSVAFSPDGHTLATGSADHTVRLWDVVTGRLIRILRGHTGEVYSVAFSRDGHTLATGSADSTARLWNVGTGKPIGTLIGHFGPVYSVAFSPDKRTLATGSADKTVRLWGVASGTTRTALIGHTGVVYSVAFSPDGHTLATGSADLTVRLWDVASGTTRTTLAGHTGEVYSVAFSPDGRAFASGSADMTAKLWDLGAVATRTILSGHTDAVDAVAFSPDGRTLATGSADLTVRLSDVATGATRVTLAGHTDRVDAVAFSPDGRSLATGSADKTVRLWDVSTGKTRSVLTGHTDAVDAVAFSPDGRSLATGSADKTVRLWDVSTGKTRSVLTGHTDAVDAVAFSPDGRTLATGSADQTAKLWDLGTGRLNTTALTGHTGAVDSVAFSADGRALATASVDHTVRLWDVGTGKLHTVLIGHTGAVDAVAFSPNGRTLASASADFTVRLWDPGTGVPRTVLSGHTGTVDAVAFSPYGSTLASASTDKTVRLWNVVLSTPTGAIQKICRTVRRDLTTQERNIYLPGRSVTPSCPTQHH